ncbi:OmpP1/FadL family transporter [Hymenobacter sp. BT491]|uniref:OmpP1/FadL family transporter n=1 Tax=Hymenobacter sp. BT491 TaxID=2766779 RepID=UPI0016534602|nr:outer membrane protein transport protein [Hymenobacter sp. BT491]MBC6991514.1 outer membrane protein transport protein [Hymenobacter sp. BT491]
MKLKSLLLVGGALLTGTAATAGGFQVNLAGQKNVGMGGVGVGLALDHAAMFYNPGALAMIRQNGVQVGVNAALARVSYVQPGGGTQRELQHNVVTPFNLYASFGPAEGKFRAGIAVYTPFGSKLEYASGWEGRYSLTQIDLQSIFVQPTISYALTDKISVGAGLVVLAYGAVNLQKDIPLPSSNGSIELDGKAEHKLGYNAGIYFKPTDNVSLGFSYRSKVDAHVKSGDVSFNNISSSFGSRFTATKFDVTLPLPATFSFGVGVTPNDKVTIGLDANYVQWSKYQTLNFAFSGNNGQGGTSGVDGQVGGANFSSSKRSYQDALTFRLGGQYKVSDALALRAGVGYDFSPVKDGYVTPETPDADRVLLSAGASYDVGEHFGVDASFLFEDFKKRSQTQRDLITNGTTDRVAGTYKTFIFVPGLGLHYNF